MVARGQLWWKMWGYLEFLWIFSFSQFHTTGIFTFQSLHFMPFHRLIHSFIHGRLARWRTWSACGVGKATSEGLENEHSLIRQPFRRLTYVTAHSPILPASLHVHHRHFTYVSWLAAHAFIHSFIYLFHVILLHLFHGYENGTPPVRNHTGWLGPKRGVHLVLLHLHSESWSTSPRALWVENEVTILRPRAQCNTGKMNTGIVLLVAVPRLADLLTWA